MGPYIVLRHRPNFPPDRRLEDLEGRWMDAVQILGDPPEDSERLKIVGPVAVARPTGRTEVRDDGEVAEVWEIGEP